MGGHRVPNLNYQVTAQLRAGSLIQFENVHSVLETSRALGIILRMEWNPRHASSRAHVMIGSGVIMSVDINSISKVLVL